MHISREREIVAVRPPQEARKQMRGTAEETGEEEAEEANKADGPQKSAPFSRGWVRVEAALCRQIGRRGRRDQVKERM